MRVVARLLAAFSFRRCVEGFVCGGGSSSRVGNHDIVSRGGAVLIGGHDVGDSLGSTSAARAVLASGVDIEAFVCSAKLI